MYHFEENNTECAAIIKKNRSGSPYALSTTTTTTDSPETLEDWSQHHHCRLCSSMLVATQLPNRNWRTSLEVHKKGKLAPIHSISLSYVGAVVAWQEARGKKAAWGRQRLGRVWSQGLLMGFWTSINKLGFIGLVGLSVMGLICVLLWAVGFGLSVFHIKYL